METENPNVNVDIYDDDLIIRFEDEEDLDVSFDEDIVLEVEYHNELEGLDYEHAGHTGFMPSSPTNLNDFDSEATNEQIELFGNDSTNPGKINLNDLHDKIVLLDGVKVNNQELPIDLNRKVNIDLSDYALGNQAVARTTIEVNTTNYVITLTTYDRGNNVLNTSQIDLPVESVVVNGSYDNLTKSLILTLQNGNTITIPVGDLINGLQSEITAQNMLASDLVDDTNNTHKFVSQAQKDKLDNIEAQAQVNVLEGVQVNGSDLTIDQNKKVNLVLSNYFAPVSEANIRALFTNGGGE